MALTYPYPLPDREPPEDKGAQIITFKAPDAVREARRLTRISQHVVVIREKLPALKVSPYPALKKAAWQAGFHGAMLYAAAAKSITTLRNREEIAVMVAALSPLAEAGRDQSCRLAKDLFRTTAIFCLPRQHQGSIQRRQRAYIRRELSKKNAQSRYKPMTPE